MKKQVFVYGLFALALLGSAELAQSETSNVTAIVTIASRINSNELIFEPPCEACYEENIDEYITERELQ